MSRILGKCFWYMSLHVTACFLWRWRNTAATLSDSLDHLPNRISVFLLFMLVECDKRKADG